MLEQVGGWYVGVLMKGLASEVVNMATVKTTSITSILNIQQGLRFSVFIFICTI